MNNVTLFGNLGADPELKNTGTGKAVCNLSVATTERYNEQDSTEWHSVVCWEKTAENVCKYLNRGSKVLVNGRLQTRSWEDKEGKKQYKTEIVAHRVEFGSPVHKGQRKDESADSTNPDNTPF